MIEHMAHFLWSILELIPNLKAFGEGWNNKEHVHVLWMFITLVNKSFAYGKKRPKMAIFQGNQITKP
jgi:hypothetical protein